MNDLSSEMPVDSVECRTSRDAAVRTFILAAMLIGAGIWCWSDPREPPEAWDLKNINDAAAYVLNNWGPYLFMPVGLIFAIRGILFLNRRIIADGEGIGYVGKKIAWSEITGLDATRLEAKGILLLHYGQGKTLTLDSWKLQNFRDLVAFIETHVPKDRQVTASTKAE